MDRLNGNTALVTGGAQGIGFGIARRFAAEGAELLLVDLAAEELDAAANELRAQGARVETLAMDAADPALPEAVLALVARTFGKVDILVNNAGLAISGTIQEFTDDQWTSVLTVNLTAAFRLSKALIDGMIERRFGRVINITSMNGIIGMRQTSGYAVTKCGLHALTRSIAVDYGPYGVTANAIAPGPIETRTNSAILRLRDPESWFMKTVVQNKPVSGLGHVDDIAATAAFLASNEARFITGQVISVDGGLANTRYVPDAPGEKTARYVPPAP